MNEKACRWGIMSTALIGRKNWKAIKNSGNGVVAAVASREKNASEAFIADCQSEAPFDTPPKALGSYHELVESRDIDAVYIPLPTGLRKEWVIRAARAGKHVVCEKPCAVSASDLQEMIDVCTEHNVQFMDGVMFMHTDRMNKIREILDDPQSVGPLKRIATQFSFRAPEEFKAQDIRTDSRLEPYGCLGDLGWYTIRFILWVMQYQMPTRMYGRFLSQLQRADSPYPVPMEFSGELFFEDGVSATFYNSFLTENQQWANVGGTKGYLHVPDFVLPYYGNELRFYLSQAKFIVSGCDFVMENHTRTITASEYGNSHPLAPETNLFRQFANLVSTGDVDSHWPKIALQTQRVMDACYQSAQEDGRPIEFSESVGT